MRNVFNISGEPLYLNYSTPEAYGAVGDGVVDDTSAVQSAIDNGRYVLFGAGKIYRIDGILRIPKDTYIDLNGSTVIGYASKLRVFYNFKDSDDSVTGYNGNGNITITNGTIKRNAMAFIHGPNIALRNLRFEDCHNDHFVEIAGCKDFIIDGCSFVGMDTNGVSVHEYINVDPCTRAAFPHFSNASAATYDGTKNDGIEINNCYFSIGEGEFNTGYNAFGVHGVGGNTEYHKNINLTNNIILGFTGCGLRINDMDNVIILGNIIESTGDGIRVGDVGQSTNVLVKGNVITASGTAITKANNSTVFQSADNDINPTFS